MDHPEVIDHPEVPTAVIRGRIRMDQMAEFYDRSYGVIAACAARQGASPQAAFALYLAPPGEEFELEVGFLLDRPIERDDEVLPSYLPAGRVARLIHHGSYEHLPQSWGRLLQWISEQGWAPAGPMWEVYVTEPTPQTDPTTLRTDLLCVVDDGAP